MPQLPKCEWPGVSNFKFSSCDRYLSSINLATYGARLMKNRSSERFLTYDKKPVSPATLEDFYLDSHLHK